MEEPRGGKKGCQRLPSRGPPWIGGPAGLRPVGYAKRSVAPVLLALFQAKFSVTGPASYRRGPGEPTMTSVRGGLPAGEAGAAQGACVAAGRGVTAGLTSGRLANLTWWSTSFDSSEKLVVGVAPGVLEHGAGRPRDRLRLGRGHLSSWSGGPSTSSWAGMASQPPAGHNALAASPCRAAPPPGARGTCLRRPGLGWPAGPRGKGQNR